jgi:hypothetical protein
MSTTSVLARLGLRQGFRTLHTTARRSSPLALSCARALTTRSQGRFNGCSLNTSYTAVSRRFYSGGILKSEGNMRVAVIGQSMFGQEVWYSCSMNKV